jgi:hypothetical protein
VKGVKWLVAAIDKGLTFNEVFSWSGERINSRREDGYFITDALEDRQYLSVLVFAMFKDISLEEEPHAFVLKRLEKGNWVYLDAAESQPLYMKPKTH